MAEAEKTKANKAQENGTKLFDEFYGAARKTCWIIGIVVFLVITLWRIYR